MTTKLYDGDTFTINGRTYRVNFEQEQYPELPWNFCDCHGPVRQSNKPHRDGYGDKHPGERPLNSPDRNEYQFYYNWEEAMKIAKRDIWNTKPYDAPNKALRAVQADFDYLRGFLDDDWCYLTVTVTDVETGEDDSLGMVESIGECARECACEIGAYMARTYAVNNRFTDAMALGV
jgi:hypothetical protein